MPPDLAATIGRTRLPRLRHASELTGCAVLARAGPLNPALLRDKGMPAPARLVLAFPG
ncbi:MAG TPA: hypothetical protein VMV99_04165 [Rhodanobacter sp.]|nr:hypothetical protein [Rhodanobacter sp.]